MASFIEIRAQQKQRENQANAIEVLARQRLRQQQFERQKAQFERQKAQQQHQFGEAAGQGLGINLRALGRGGISTQSTTPFPEPPPQPPPQLPPATLEEIRAGIQLDPKAAAKRFLGMGKKPVQPSFGKPFETQEFGFVTVDKSGNVKALNLTPPKDTTEAFTQENVLRDDFTKASSKFDIISSSYGRVIASGKDPSAAGDLALIFNYMKILDPGSVVRESEFATAETSRAFLEDNVPSFILRARDKILFGARLAPKQRLDFLNRAEMLFISADKKQKSLERQFTGIAKRNKLNPENIIIDVRVPQESKVRKFNPATGKIE